MYSALKHGKRVQSNDIKMCCFFCYWDIFRNVKASLIRGGNTCKHIREFEFVSLARLPIRPKFSILLPCDVCGGLACSCGFPRNIRADYLLENGITAFLNQVKGILLRRMYNKGFVHRFYRRVVVS